MRRIAKLILLCAFVALPALCQSQSITTEEFVNLTLKKPKEIKNTLLDKGYVYQVTEGSDLSSNEVYSGQNGATISLIRPSFKDGQGLLMWEFAGNDMLYQDLQRQLAADGYDVLDSEVRSGKRYISTTYQKTGITLTLSCDKQQNSNGVYRLSARYSPPSGWRITSK